MNGFNEKLNKIKKHWPALLTAFFVGLIIFLPNVMSIYRLGTGNFNGIYPIFDKDETYYLTMAADVARGQKLGNPYLKEHQNEHYLVPDLIEKFLVGESRVLGLDIPETFMANDFILPFFGFIILYFFIFSLTDKRSISLIYSIFLFTIFIASFGRPVNPQLSFIFVIIGVWLIALIQKFLNQEIKEKKIYFAFFSLALVIGILVYIYPYFWTSLLVLLFLILSFYTVKEKKFNYILPLLGFIFFLLILVIPYLINTWQINHISYYSETLQRIGLLNNHWPACYFNTGLSLLTLFFYFLIKKKQEQNYFSLALIISPVILNWQNVITGKYLQFSSHYYLVTIFFLTLAMIILLDKYDWRENKTNKNILIFLFAAIIILPVAYKQKGEVIGTFCRNLFQKNSSLADMQNYAPVFDWFNNNSEEGKVIYVLGKASAFISIYTRNYEYMNGYANAYLVSDSELEDRWVRQNIFLDINEEYIRSNSRGIWYNGLIDQYQNSIIRNKIIKALIGINIQAEPETPQAFIDRVYKKYQEVKKENIESALKKYEIDYILLDTKDGRYKGVLERLNNYKFIREVKKFDNYAIYEVS